MYSRKRALPQTRGGGEGDHLLWLICRYSCSSYAFVFKFIILKKQSCTNWTSLHSCTMCCSFGLHCAFRPNIYVCCLCTWYNIDFVWDIFAQYCKQKVHFIGFVQVHRSCNHHLSHLCQVMTLEGFLSGHVTSVCTIGQQILQIPCTAVQLTVSLC